MQYTPSELALSEQLAQQVKVIGQLLEQQRQDELQQQQQQRQEQQQLLQQRQQEEQRQEQQQQVASPQQLAGLQQIEDYLFSPGGVCCMTTMPSSRGRGLQDALGLLVLGFIRCFGKSALRRCCVAPHPHVQQQQQQQWQGCGCIWAWLCLATVPVEHLMCCAACQIF
jgi:hypothetical protein